MTIKRSLSGSTLLLAAGDTTILNPTAGRYNVTYVIMNETTGAAETVTLHRETSAASTAANRIANLSFAANETKAVNAALITLNAGEYLVANATTGARVNITLVYTQFDGDS